jgi:Uma2 family endonuclease
MALKGPEVLLPPVTDLDEPERTDDPFYYGYRMVITQDESGEETLTFQPLTLEDFLDPQEGDHFVQGTLHDEDTERAKSIFRYIHRDNPAMTVYRDLKFISGIAGLSKPAPDVMVIPNVKDPHKPRGEFDVTVEGTRPLFVLEIVSPRYRQPDRERKVKVYERAGIQEYVIIDSHLRGEAVRYEVLGYRLKRGRYVEIRPDKRGWVYSQVNDVWIGANEARDRFFVVDAHAGQEILPAEERAEAAEAQLQAEVAARVEAERQAQAEAAARAEAERQLLAIQAEVARLRRELGQTED